MLSSLKFVTSSLDRTLGFSPLIRILGLRYTFRWDPTRSAAKRGPGATLRPDRARINRARNKDAMKRKKEYVKRQEFGIRTTKEVLEERSRQPDSEEYLKRQAEYSQYLTIFGRKTVRDALRDDEINFKHVYMDEKLLTATLNARRTDADFVVQEIIDLCRNRKIELKGVDRVRIGIISKAGRQDGGVVADIIPAKKTSFSRVEDYIKACGPTYRILAIDQVTNPANMGMIIRSVVAANTFDAILLGPGTVPENSPLVIKASAGASLTRTKKLNESEESVEGEIGSSNLTYIHTSKPLYFSLNTLKNDGAEVILLAAKSKSKPAPVKDQSVENTVQTSNDSFENSDPNSSNQQEALDNGKQLFTSFNRGASQPISLYQYTPKQKTVFVIGGESAGHDPMVVQSCTSHVYIPMSPSVESLNVAVTASLVAYSPQLLFSRQKEPKL